MENAKVEVAKAGPMALERLATLCAIPVIQRQLFIKNQIAILAVDCA